MVVKRRTCRDVQVVTSQRGRSTDRVWPCGHVKKQHHPIGVEKSRSQFRGWTSSWILLSMRQTVFLQTTTIRRAICGQTCMSKMANSSCMSRRLVQALTQTPPTRSTSRYLPCYPCPPKDWIRTITSSSTRYTLDTPGVSFGIENDGVIAPYVEKLNKKSKTKKKKPTELSEAVPSEDYEIGGFIDRSTSKKGRTFTPIEERLQTVNDDQVEPPANTKTKRKPGRPRTGDTSPDNHQATRKPDSTFPKPTMLTRKVETNAPGGHRFRKLLAHIIPLRRPYVDTVKIRKVDPAMSGLKYTPGEGGRPLERKKTEDADTWAIQKNALKEKFKDGWQPRKKLSPDAMDGIRGLHEQDPIKYSTELLAEQFQMSPEAIRRILKSKWLARQSPEKLQERRERWAKRHDRIWDAQAELGLRPPRTKDKEIEDPDKFEQELERRRILGEIDI